jgi:DNA-binding GntR family transcriptional regulator
MLAVGRGGKKMTIKKSAIHEMRQAASLRSRVENSLASAIISGALEPGTLVSVPSLAARFAVSATPVREAMLNLENRGFVQSVKNKGFRVTEVSDQDLQEIVQLRRWLEAPAMHIVAEHLHGASLEHYLSLADRIVTAAEQSKFEDYIAADSEFHLALLELAGNRRLVDFIAELRRQTRMGGLANLGETEELKQSAFEHRELLQLLGEGQGDAAEKLMLRHIGHIRGWWSGAAEIKDSGGTS